MTPPDGPLGRLLPTLEVNPSCVISAVVRWTTEQPASSFVEFGEIELDQRIGSDALTTEHEVVVVGMWADTTFNLEAVSTTEDGQTLRSQPMEFATGSLPQDQLTVRLETLDETRSAGGWTLYNANTGNLVSQIRIVMIDMQGRTVWYYLHGGGPGRLDAQVSWKDGTVLYAPAVDIGERSFRVNLKGEIVWEGPLQVGNGFGQDGTLHHVGEPTAEGGVLVARFDEQYVEGKRVMSDGLVEYNADGEIIWTWEAIDHLGEIPLDIATFPEGGDWMHINSAAIDPNGEFVYFSSWIQEKFFKIDRLTGEIIWIAGVGGDFTADPTATIPWFTVLHALEYLGDNRFMLYDNNEWDRRSSRAVLYHLDEQTMQATELWAYEGKRADAWYNNVGGDADPLPNGNVFIVGGTGGTSASNATRFMEVTPGGRLVWRVWPFQGAGGNVTVFGAERVPALAQPIE